MVELYFHSPIFLHGLVLNCFSIGTTLPLPFIKLVLCGAMTQRAGYQILTVGIQIQCEWNSCGICGEQSDNGAGFSPSILVSHASYHSTNVSQSSTVRDWYSRPIWGHSSKGLGLTPLPQLAYALLRTGALPLWNQRLSMHWICRHVVPPETEPQWSPWLAQISISSHRDPETPSAWQQGR
jgi:hypothetical protein